MRSYIKTLDEDQQRYRKGLINGVELYSSIPSDEHINLLDKYVFKNADLMAEIAPTEFPFKLKKDTCFTVLSVKGDVINILVEVEAEKSYHVKYLTDKVIFEMVISWNEKEEEVNTNAFFSDALLNLLEKSKINNSNLVDLTVNNLSKMIGALNEESYTLQHKTVNEVKQRTKTSYRNMGKPTLVTTRFKNMLHICDAFPYFYDIDFKQMDLDYGKPSNNS